GSLCGSAALREIPLCGSAALREIPLCLPAALQLGGSAALRATFCGFARNSSFAPLHLFAHPPPCSALICGICGRFPLRLCTIARPPLTIPPFELIPGFSTSLFWPPVTYLVCNNPDCTIPAKYTRCILWPSDLPGFWAKVISRLREIPGLYPSCLLRPSLLVHR